MFGKVLIANRGEIAVRILRACQELGIATVAVYTEADREARHVRLADQSFRLEPDSYLAVEALIDVARRAGADAVHPGYGFLAENAGFAHAVLQAGLGWIGPNPEAIALMGSKTVARRMAAQARVPVVPGTHDPLTDPEVARAFAEEHGYPCVIKAAAGGGGRGMQLVRQADELAAAIAKGIREGEAYFGSGEVFIERYLDQPRHIEIQVVCDTHGHAVALGERECSIQRRHQKLIEECPSVALTPELRREMGEASVRMARAVGYDSVGTCEFLCQDGAFYFLEMNTRIQVEHTVTEEVYGVDLLKEQIRLAAGAQLDEGLLAGGSPRGWAIECRINAEDPSQNFRPAPGLITAYRRPAGPGLRVDDAVEAGSRISELYDSLIAKVIATGRDRPEAIARMRRALRELQVEGVPTTIPLHLALLDHPDFLAGDLSTHFIGQKLTPEDLKRLVSPAPAPVDAPPPALERRFEVVVSRERFEVTVQEIGGTPTMTALKPRKPAAGSLRGAEASGTVCAPMHAVVARVLVEPGQPVSVGQPMVVLEAMKMETEIPSPLDGTVHEIRVKAGQTVEGGQVMGVVA